MNIRNLSTTEIRIILALLRKASMYTITESILQSAQVLPQDDGGMGSIKFVYDKNSKYDSDLSTFSFRDHDDVEVNLVLSLDEFGRLYELDVWKVDFSPVIKWPSDF